VPQVRYGDERDMLNETLPIVELSIVGSTARTCRSRSAAASIEGSGSPVEQVHFQHPGLARALWPPILRLLYRQTRRAGRRGSFHPFTQPQKRLMEAVRRVERLRCQEMKILTFGSSRKLDLEESGSRAVGCGSLNV
jgi:hypothetical protein